MKYVVANAAGGLVTRDLGQQDFDLGFECLSTSEHVDSHLFLGCPGRVRAAPSPTHFSSTKNEKRMVEAQIWLFITKLKSTKERDTSTASAHKLSCIDYIGARLEHTNDTYVL